MATPFACSFNIFYIYQAFILLFHKTLHPPSLFLSLSVHLPLSLTICVPHLRFGDVESKVLHIHYTVVPSSDHCRTETVLPPSDHYSIQTVAPSGDHYCIDVVVSSSDHCCTETAPPSSDHYGTTKVTSPSDHLHTKIT